MMYELLAHVYDALVKDDEATQEWVSLIKKHIKGKELLELACGSGEITIALAQEGYQVTASDLSADMIAEARKKSGSELVEWSVMDMCELHMEKQFDGILCLCDSFNYILKETQVRALFQGAYAHLKPQGVFLVDMHSLDRLAEFEEEYNEAGQVKELDYQWTITSEEDRIYQNFAFYDAEGRITLEQHEQRVYAPDWILAELEKRGFQVEVYTDFTKPAICEGEKQFYICKKGGGVQ
ncbi:MAG: class I SAM-dependent methyltransferase [Clostridium sp.]|nr:class I SAM-dependent methyltransferase [Erysipelotrichaceae bacterium]MCR0521005.1 class I SAM-dependent methyltransferase [[Clostridium] innocuum]MCR0624581.1 class I SAM-dependent methyltransferase [[Clostridium] innocuum]